MSTKQSDVGGTWTALGEAREPVRDLRGGGRPAAWLLLEQRVHQLDERVGKRGMEVPERGRRSRGDVPRLRLEVGATRMERQDAGQPLVGDDAEGVEVGARVHAAAER